eukprot:g229.t1
MPPQEQEVSVGADGKTVLVNGQKVAAGDVHNDKKPDEQPILLPNYITGPKATTGENDYSGSEQDETPEECFINDCRFGELEDVLKTVNGTSEFIDGKAHPIASLVNAQNEQGHTALMMAAGNGHVEIVAELLRVPSVNLLLQNKAGNTALHWAAFMGRKKVCELLLGSEIAKANGSEVGRELCNRFNEAKKNPFDEAQGKGYSGVCEVLAVLTNFEYCSPEPDKETDRKYGIGGA